MVLLAEDWNRELLAQLPHGLHNLLPDSDKYCNRAKSKRERTQCLLKTAQTAQGDTEHRILEVAHEIAKKYDERGKRDERGDKAS